MGKALRPAAVAGTQLPQDGEQSLAGEGVDLVEKQHHGAGRAFAPGSQITVEPHLGIHVMDGLGRRRTELRRQVAAGVGLDRPHHHVDPAAGVVAGRAGGLAGGQEGGVAARGGELPRQVVEAGRLA